MAWIQRLTVKEKNLKILAELLSSYVCFCKINIPENFRVGFHFQKLLNLDEIVMKLSSPCALYSSFKR